MWVISENDLAIFVFELLLFSLFEMCAYTFMFCTDYEMDVWLVVRVMCSAQYC